MESYDTSNIKIMNRLIATSNQELMRNYLKRNHRNQKPFAEYFSDVINIRNNDEYNSFKHTALTCLNGPNFTYIINQLSTRANVLTINNGYQLRLETVLSDLNQALMHDQRELVKSARDVKTLSPYVKSIVDDFIDKILLDKTILPLVESLHV